MTAQRAVPRFDASSSANNRFKGRFRSIFWSAMILATVAHFGAFAYWPELTAEDFAISVAELTALELPPEIEVPPAPEAIARPATPVVASADISEDITIAPTTFEMNPIEELPPPPTLADEVVDIGASPTFTPFTVAPDILNRTEVVAAMIQLYPPMFRESGIGGLVRVFFFINEEGIVENARIDKSSGYQQFDDAALALADLYRFSPALNRDQRVPVWVSFPIEFAVRR